MPKHVRRSIPLIVAALGWGVVVWATRTPRVAVADLPPMREVVAAVGKRLGQELSPGELTRIVKRGDRVLARLTRAERWAMGRDAIRFRVDRRAGVGVAAPARSVPFWLADQGFARTGVRLRNEDGEFAVYRRSVPAGVIGLG